MFESIPLIMMFGLLGQAPVDAARAEVKERRIYREYYRVPYVFKYDKNKHVYRYPYSYQRKYYQKHSPYSYYDNSPYNYGYGYRYPYSYRSPPNHPYTYYFYRRDHHRYSTPHPSFTIRID